jgi:hypothetical protein
MKTVIVIAMFFATSACAQLSRNVDEITKSITISSSLRHGMSFQKTIDGKDTSVFLMLNGCGASPNVGTTGSVVLFSDSTQLSFDTKNDVEVGEGGRCAYHYIAACLLRPSDVAQLCTKTVKLFRVYIYDRTMDNASAINLQADAKLVRDAN